MGVPVLHYRRAGLANWVAVARTGRYGNFLRADGWCFWGACSAGVDVSNVRAEKERW